MLPDLHHLIRLQELDLTAERLRRRLTELPAARAALETRVAEREAAVASIKARTAESQTARRDIEKELAAVQGRLSKYKDQLMEVKTNKEYQAMQHEIAAAEQLVRSHEDRLLDRMEEGETLAASMKTAESELKAEHAEVARAGQQLDAERVSLDRELERLVAERTQMTATLTPAALALFEHVSRQRRGLALSEARDGHCTQCHVRLRPQVFNEVRRNDSIIQCDSCSRILYFVPAAAAGVAPQAS